MKLAEELAKALKKVRAEHDLIKFGDEFFSPEKMHFQRLAMMDKFVPYFEKVNLLSPGEPVSWEGPVEIGCPELFLLRSKSTDQVYVLAPDDYALDVLETSDVVAKELVGVLALVPEEFFPFDLGGKQLVRDQMVFTYIPELEALVLGSPHAGILPFDGLPYQIDFGDDEEAQKMFVCGSAEDGRLYVLAPRPGTFANDMDAH